MLKQRTIFFFWLPLALSWFLMAFEQPWVQGVIGRLPDDQLQLAAFGLLVSLMVLIESPIIMLLGTSAALSRDKQAFDLLARFTVILNTLVTVMALLMAFTPLLDWWLGTVVGVSDRLIEAVRPGVRVMALWPAFVGTRRFLQGLMIRQNHTRPIGYGTVIRLGSSAGTAVLLGLLTSVPGAVVGAAAMATSALIEMLYVLVVSREDVRTVRRTARKADLAPLTLPGTFKFHVPLAMTSVIMLLMRPLVERGLANTPNAEASLAAWAVVFSTLFIVRAGGMAWQEAVISLSESEEATRALRRFTWTMGGALTGILALLLFTPLMNLYTGAALNVPENIRPLVRVGAQAGLLIPLLTTLQSYLRGLLMRSDTTTPIYGAIMASFGTTALVMWLGVQFTTIEGVLLGSLALTLGYVAEMAVLWWALRANDERLEMVYAAAGD